MNTAEPSSTFEVRRPGRLDGTTIVRFAHAFSSGGGTERYLDDLDRILLTRNAMTIIRIFIGNASETMQRSEPFGRGILELVPLSLPKDEQRQLASDFEPQGIQWKVLLRNHLLYNRLVWKFFSKRYIKSRRIARRQGQVLGAGVKFRSLLDEFNIDLTILHYFGGSDADEIVETCRNFNRPYALLNHYSNDRFLGMSVRKHAMTAAAVAGVNGLGVPEYLKNGFTNLSDGIDTDYFETSRATLPVGAPDTPLILLPARIVRTKGHLDLVKAAAALRRDKIEVTVAFAGRAGSSEFDVELRRLINKLGLQKRVLFLGELSVEMLRDWYKAAAVVAFPTYHHEGLGRVTIEAQSMNVPVVVYAVGGTPEGLISGATGYLLQPGNIEGLTAKLRELLTNTKHREAMGLAGRKMVEDRFSLQALASRHEEFYLRVISTHGKNPLK